MMWHYFKNSSFAYEDIFLFNGKVVVSVAGTGSFSQRVHDYVERATIVVDEMRETLPS